MTRLIDTNNAISVCEILSEKGGNPHYWNQLISIIEDMPTIDAIPIEFLERRREGLIFAAMTGSQVYGNKTIELCHAINIVLDMWQKEQEGGKT